MASVKRSISITEQQNQWVKARIANGDFGNESEVYRALIRKAQSEEQKLEELRHVLDAGEADIKAGRYRVIEKPEDVSAVFSKLKSIPAQ